MKTFQHLVILTSMLLLLSAIPATAQIDAQVTFEAPFAFYAGNAQMPAGRYTVTQPDDLTHLLLIERADRSHSVFVNYVPVESTSPSSKTEIAFNKYGTADFLNRIALQGQEFGMEVVASQPEQKAATTTSAEKHSLSATRGR